jgi:hypothetical protein
VSGRALARAQLASAPPALARAQLASAPPALAQLALAAAILAFGACGKLQNFGGPATPLVTFSVVLDGDTSVAWPPGVTSDHALKVGLIWGAQWLTEPFCILPPESTDAATVIDKGCRSAFGFVPARLDQSAPLVPGQPASLPLFALPSADVLVGDVTSRVAYGTLVVYDDRDDSGTLELSRPHRLPTGDMEGMSRQTVMVDSADIIYGASFFSMTAPDERVAYREGAPPTGAFYPRAGCDPPPPSFSIVGAGGFSASDAIAATLAGTLPQEAPGGCSEGAPDVTTVHVVVAQGPAVVDVDEVGCDESVVDGSSRYRQPPQLAPDFTDRVTACVHLPSFDIGGGLGLPGLGGDADGGVADGGAADAGAPLDQDGGADGGAAIGASLIQLVVSGRSTDKCKGLTHYTLRGCRDSVTCALPDWDFTANPPPWWPCPH